MQRLQSAVFVNEASASRSELTFALGQRQTGWICFRNVDQRPSLCLQHRAGNRCRADKFQCLPTVEQGDDDTIPNQSSVAKAFMEFGEDGRMKPSAYYERVVDVMKELLKFTLLTRNAPTIWSTGTASG